MSAAYPDTFPGQTYGVQPLSEQDPNSPDMFRDNIRLVQSHIENVRSLARDALDGIERAYQPNTSPSQTAANLANLKLGLQNLSDVLRTTGVGALPLVEMGTMQGPPEEQLVQQTTEAIKTLFTQHTRNQENAVVAVNLLTASEPLSRR
ncbi:hypothetical protein DENSPDRAFT_782680 [Dentipellis sp. KUC8613]|nr:hypothetical protein DENSPDRAFT_782680 [Dentipellis sp. KUC8613]